MRPKEMLNVQNSEPASTFQHEDTRRNESIWNFASYPLALPLGDNPEEIVRKLGEPLSLRNTPIENKHTTGQTDIIHELKYEGLRIFIYESTSSSPQRFLHTLLIDGNYYELKEGIKIGMTKAEILNKFRKADLVSRDMISYISGSEAGNNVTFSFRNDLLIRISWMPYLD